MYIIDVNTSFGKRVDSDPRFLLPGLVEEFERHNVACALTFSLRGVEYDARAGNTETLAAASGNPRLIPVATIDPRDCLTSQAEIDRCLKAKVCAFRFFPGLQGWTVNSFCFRKIMEHLEKNKVCLIFSTTEGSNSWESISDIARITAKSKRPVILTGASYPNMAEIIAALQEFDHLYVETSWLATVGAIEIMVQEVGADRILYGSGAPAHPMQKALNQILEAAIPDKAKAAILGGNAMRLLAIPRERSKKWFKLQSAEPVVFEEPIVDVHSHLGYWRFPLRSENYDPGAMLQRMKRFGIGKSIVSSYESMRYDFQSGNKAIASAIKHHPELLGYVELNPYQLELSCAEMDRYYQLPNFVGCEVELIHIPCPAGSPKIRALMAEIAKRKKPVLFMPGSPNDAEAECRLARDNPNLVIIHAHGFDAEWARTVKNTPNILVEFCASRASHHNLRDGLNILGPERILFGSDQTFLSVGAAIGLYWDADMTPPERRLVLYENARRIFKI